MNTIENRNKEGMITTMAITCQILRPVKVCHAKTGPAYNRSAWTTYGCHNWSRGTRTRD